MTVCISAICQHNGEPRIVLCSDWMVDNEWMTSETMNKQICIAPRWYALPAGSVARGNELMAEFRIGFAKESPKIGRILPLFNDIVNSRRRKIIEETVQSAIGKEYEWLLEKGKASLPDDSYSRLIQSVEYTKLGAQLILSGFVAEKDTGMNIPAVCSIDDSTAPCVRMAENFATIGSGAVVAESVLHRRSQQCDMPLKKTLYNVFEAKRLAEASMGGSSGVGETTTIGVLLPTGRYVNLSDKAVDFLAGCFTKYGPKALENSESWDMMPHDFLKLEEPSAQSSVA